MSKTPRQSQSSRDARRKGLRKSKAVVIVALLLSIAGIILAQWQGVRLSASSSSLTLEPPAPQISQTPQLSKEYIYAGGRLVATEETPGTSITASATFIKTDITTQGNWKGKYGSDGYNIINDVVNNPSYAQVTSGGNNSYTWTASTSDVRALQKAATTTDRLAACWYSSSYFTLDVNITDGQTHQIGLYALDWDGNNGRAQQIDILDAVSNTVLDSRSVSAFSSGKYLIWHISGHVVIKLTSTGIYNSVISGIFFDPTRTNVALAANGGVASASSQYSTNFPVTAAINGDRYSLYLPDNRYNLWASGVGAPKPDWLQVDFSATKTINEIDVVTQQDSNNPVNPTEATTFTLYGPTAFEVQYWTGSSWATVPGGSVTGNNKVWRKFSFSPITTSKVRVLINATADSYSRVMELEAWGTN